MQRVRLRFHLQTRAKPETKSYNQHRHDVAGAGDREIFAPDTYTEVYRYCGGVPRLINTLCDTAMMAAYTADRGAVTRADIISAVRELQWVEYSARPRPTPTLTTPTTTTQQQQPQQPQPQSEPETALAAAAAGAEPGTTFARLLVSTEGRTVHEITLRIGPAITGCTPDNDRRTAR